MVDDFDFDYDGSGKRLGDDIEGRKLARDSSRRTEDNSARIERLESKLNNLSLITEAL